MKKFEYTCDICGDPIKPEKRKINANGYSLQSHHDSIHKMTLKTVDIDNSGFVLDTEQESKDYDVCETCWDAIISTMRERKK